MPENKIKINGTGAVAIPAPAVDKLINEPNGNAIRLYLYLLKEGNCVPEDAGRRLGLDSEALREALNALTRAGLAGDMQMLPAEPPAPQYTGEDVSGRIASDPAFEWLVGYTEQTMGRPLTVTDTASLLRISDWTGMSAEVLAMLIRHCADLADPEGKTGRRTTLRQIEKQAAIWEQNGVDTPEKANNFIKRQDKTREGVMRILRSLRVDTITPSIETTVAGWLDTGLPDETLLHACDLTVHKTGSMKWPYADSIIKSWVSKGLRTLEDIERSDKPAGSGKNVRKQGKPAVTERELEIIRRTNERAKNMGGPEQ